MQVAAVDFEYEAAEFVFEIAVAMHSFRTSLDIGSLGIDAMISKALAALDKPSDRINHDGLTYEAHA